MALGKMSQLNSQFSNRTAQKSVTVSKSTDHKINKFGAGNSGVKLNPSGRRSWTPAVSYKNSTVFKELQNFRFMLNTNSYPLGNLQGNARMQANSAMSDLNALYNMMDNWGGGWNVGSGNSGYDTAKMIMDVGTVGLNLADTLYRIFNSGDDKKTSTTTTTTTEANPNTKTEDPAANPTNTNGKTDPTNTTGVNPTNSTTGSSPADPTGNIDSSAAQITLNTSKDFSASLSGLKNAKNSTEMRSAIGNAEAQLASINDEIKRFNVGSVQDLKDARSTADKAQGQAKNQLGTTNQAVEAADKQIDLAQGQKDTAQNKLDKQVAVQNQVEVDYAQAVKDHNAAKDKQNEARCNNSLAQSRLEKAEANFNKAKADASQAEISYNTAQQNYEKEPETLKDGKPNPQKAILKRQAEQAKIAWENAKAAEKRAEEALNGKPNGAKAKKEAAQKAYDDATRDLSKKEENRQNKEKALQDAKGITDDHKKDLINAGNDVDLATANLDTKREDKRMAQVKQDEAEDNFEIAKDNYKKADANLDKYRDLCNQKEKLEEKIEDAKKDLAEMEADEAKDFDKLNKNIDDKINKNDHKADLIGDTVDGLADKNRLKGINNRNNKISGLIDERNQQIELLDNSYIANTLVQQQIPGLSDTGNFYAKGTNSTTGSVIYIKNGQKISEEEYNKGNSLATAGQNVTVNPQLT